MLGSMSDSGRLMLDRLLDPIGRRLSEDVARALLALPVDPEVQARLRFLGDASSAGTLTPTERAEYEAIVGAIDFVAVLQAKARHLIASRPT
jgi:hypothetical protein